MKKIFLPLCVLLACLASEAGAQFYTSETARRAGEKMSHGDRAGARESASAQGAAPEPYVVESGGSGEISSREIDTMAAEAEESGERLFVVVRPGAGETSRRLSLGRLYNTRRYLSGKSFDPRTTVFAEGERVRGEGRIEFYLGSRLRLVVLAKRNEMPNLTCCEDYIPPAKAKPRGKGRRARR